MAGARDARGGGMDVLTYFDQATLAILHGQGCAPEQALRLARDLVDRRGKFVEGLKLEEPIVPEEVQWLYTNRPLPGTTGEGEG